MPSRRLKILQIITVFSVGGATQGVLWLARSLQEKGFDVHIVTGYNIASEGDLFREAAAANVKVTVIDTLVKEVNPLNDLKAFLTLYEFITREKFDIVHTHTAKAGILGRFAAALAGVPIIFHTLHLLSFTPHQPSILRTLFIALEKAAARVTSKFLSVSQTMINAHLNKGIGKPEDYFLIRSGIHEYFFNRSWDFKEIKRKYAERFGFSEHDFLVIKISRITKLKGQQFLIQAASKVSAHLPNVKFLIVGSGDYLPDITALVSKLHLEHSVILTGRLDLLEVAELLFVSDILAQTSLHEGLARVIQEGMALGKPIISFDLDGAWEVVKDGENGFLIDASPLTERTIDTLAEKIMLLASSPDLCRKMGEVSRSKSYPDFTIDETFRLTEQVYRSAIASSSLT